VEIDLLLIPAPPLISFIAAHETKLFTKSDGLPSFLRFTTPFEICGSPDPNRKPSWR
jgi:hypothetical protein